MSKLRWYGIIACTLFIVWALYDCRRTLDIGSVVYLIACWSLGCLGISGKAFSGKYLRITNIILGVMLIISLFDWVG